MLLQILGGDGDSDVEFDGDVDAGGADLSFKILSIQGITAFSLMFGLTGLSLVQDFGLTAALSLPLATAAGVGMVAILRKIFQVFMGFATSGTVRLENALAEQGEAISQSLRTVRDKSAHCSRPTSHSGRHLGRQR